jgi:hypothetical protein
MLIDLLALLSVWFFGLMGNAFFLRIFRLFKLGLGGAVVQGEASGIGEVKDLSVRAGCRLWRAEGETLEPYALDSRPSAPLHSEDDQPPCRSMRLTL